MGNVSEGQLDWSERRLPLRELAPPEAGAVDLWLLDLAALGSPLQPDEPVDPERFPVRQRRTLRRFYLRLLLGAYLGLPGKDVHVSRVSRGKPVLDERRHPDHGLAFSLAASQGHCLVGVTVDADIGVDLEPVGRRAGRPLALARRYFSPAETEALAALEGAALDRAFLRTWACKEAVVKAGGTGIANALCRFSVEARPGEAPSVLAMEDDDPAAWRLATFAVPGDLLGAVTVRSPQLRLAGYRLAPPT